VSNAPGLDPAGLAALRAQAVAVAYRMVGSRTDAEDLAQEAMVRVGAALAAGGVRNPEAFTTTVTTRLAIDHLRSARVRREAYVGPWLPEPVVDDPLLEGASAAELADSLSFAFLVVLESLGPLERAAFLLHDVFGYDHAEVAQVLQRSEPACRQLVARARKHLADGRARRRAGEDEHRALLERFLGAARDGDLPSLEALLTEDVVFVSDGGPDRKAARLPVRGRARVLRFLRSIGPKLLVPGSYEVVQVNGEPGFRVVADGRLHLVGTIELDPDSGAIRAIRWVLNPDKLHWVDPPAS
jgi:RNA polymerase sigma-70 factor (ECF subfamily)